MILVDLVSLEPLPAEKGILQLKPKEEEFIDWQPDRPLTWADYKGRPDPESDAAASTTTYLGIEYNIKSSQFSFRIHSRFSCDKSWGLHKTAYILSHEQGHFDIAEIYARILNKRMSEYRFDRRTYSKDLKKIYEEVVEEKEEMQNRYDKETNHSIYKVKQVEWLDKIQLMLVQTEPYADY
jgi:hypothetical protein